MTKIWYVIHRKYGNNHVVFKGSKLACKMFVKDNEFLYPVTSIKLGINGGVRLI
jgi:hypothetical protein